ncbi:MAG TPA: NnrU family protein [Azospirillaceae bacterium]|nr:NnrU family protein [Azospirillaceae bacterium]HRQ79693.1 NnrU family protein [Azospirillaceae bacterium]
MPDANFLLAALAVFLSHAVPSWPGLREVLRVKLGRAGFGALHGLGSTAALTWLILAYRAQESREMLFVPADWAPGLAVALTPVAFVLIALRLACPPGELTAPKPPSGIYRLTRAPGALGTLLWALLHLQATGDGVRVALFGLFALIAGFSLLKNHYALTRSQDAAARTFLNETALLPGWALLRRRTRFVSAEWRAWRPLLGVAAGLTAWALMLALHPVLFGVDPLALAR